MNPKRFSLHVFAAALLFIGVGCDETRHSQTESRSATLALSELALLHAIDGPDGEPMRLEGSLEPRLPNTDQPRILVLDEGLPELGVEAGTRVLDAQFVDEGVLILGADHVLRLHTKQTIREIDVMVHNPISAASGQVAYLKGGVPDMTLHRAALAGGEPQELVPGVHGFCPAISPDGREVLFSANVRGEGQLLHVDAQGEVFEVDYSGGYPAAYAAPQWRGDHLVFGGANGVTVLNLKEGRMIAQYPEAELQPDFRDDAIWFRVNGETKSVSMREVTQ